MPTNLQPKFILIAILAAYALPQTVLAEDAEKLTTEKIEVISTTPLQGVGLPKEKIPANIQSVKGDDMVNQNSLSIADSLSSGLLGINVNEVQNNPYQPNVNYRGFTASPLLGTPQGISVFVDGVRVNEPFGDVVNWDLIPLNAISNMNLIPGSNPVFGLNTLGGALSVNTKSGRTDPGGAVELSGGSWGRIQGSAEYGGVAKNGADYFFAVNALNEQGWRDASPSDVRQAFGKIGWQGDKTDANLSLTLADNELVGNGLVQKEFLDNLGWDSINTKPDITETQMVFLNFNANHYFTDDTVFSGNTYYRNARTKTLNGDVNDDVDSGVFLADCTGGLDPEAECGGALNRSKSKREGYGFTAQMTFNQDFMGKKNQLITGLGYDLGKTIFNQSTELGNITASRGVAGVGEFSDEAAVDLKAKSKTWSVFATDTFSFNDMYHLTLAGRYNHTKVENKDGLIAPPDQESLTEDATYNRFNPAIGLSITPRKDLSFYGSYNEGSRAPTAIELGCAFQDLNDGLGGPPDGIGDTACKLPNAMAGDPPLKKVVSKTFEAGVRGKVAGNLGYSASVYRSQNTDDIQFISSNPANGAGNFLNVGKTRRQGLDLGVNGELTNFRWNVGYSFIKATYQSEFKIANQVNTSAVGDEITVSKGDYLSGIPKHQLKLRGEWQALPNWTIGTNVVGFTSQYSFGNENNDHQGEGAKVRGYAVMNLDTRYKFANSGWQAFARVNNVFDKEYCSAGMLGESFFTPDGAFDSGDDHFQPLYSPGAPRAGWVGLRYEFGGKKSSSSFDND
jgi:outer membrane receptor protein involved in Fe transport